MRATRSLFNDLLRWVAGALAVGVVLLVGLWTGLEKIEYERAIEAKGREMAQGAAAAVLFDTADRPVGANVVGHIKRVTEALPKDYLFQVVDEQGTVLMASNGDRSPLLALPPPLALGRSDLTKDVDGRTLRLAVEAMVRPLRTSYVVAGRSNPFDKGLLDARLKTSQVTALIASLIAMAIVLLVVWLTLRRVFGPLVALSALAERIDSRNLRVRLPVEDAPTEVAPLISAVNSALERLESGFRNQQEFLAKVAHELKTPLTLIRSRIEMDGPIDREKVLRDIDHAARQVHQLLHLAEVSDPNSIQCTEIDLVRVASRVVDFLELLARRHGVTLALHAPADLHVVADEGAVFVLLRNLVENAIHHSNAGDVVNIEVSVRGLAVRDQGRGLLPEEIPHLFNRFWRGAHRRDHGAGLGLSICQEVTKAHGWALSAGSLLPAGAQFEVRFDAA